MIQSLWRTQWIDLIKITGYTPTQICSERLRYLSTVVSPLDKRRKTSSTLINSALGCDVERLESSGKPKLVLEFLKDCGFSESQIKSIVKQWPGILVSDPEKILKPKVNFLLSNGISKPDLVRITSLDPRVLSRSLEKHMVPLFAFLKSIVGSEENVARAVRNYPYMFRSNLRISLKSNTMELQNAGVPKSKIVKVIMTHFRAIAPHPSRFQDALTRVKEMGFHPTDPTFGKAIGAVGWCSKPAWEQKIEMFKSYGLSESEIIVGFKKQPSIMMFKEPNTRAKMDFFIKEMHWCPHKVIKVPHILLVSLKKKIIPRLSVLYVLASEGKVKEKEISSVQPLIQLAENKFVHKYITAYKDKIPQVVKAHRGELKIDGLHKLNTTVFNRNEYLPGMSFIMES